jgi:hypothetical protein
MKKLFLLSVLSLLFNCDKNTSKKDVKLKNILNDKQANEYIPHKDDKFDFNDKTLKENINKAIYKGDTTAYKQAYRYFSINYYEKEFLYYSIMMADKYDYNQAYFDTYIILSNLNTENKIDDCSVCQYYLLKSFEKNNHYAKDVIKEIFTDKGLKIPTSISVLQK